MAFEWKVEPVAETLLLELLKELCAKSDSLKQLEASLLRETSTQLFNWIDHLVVPESEEIRKQLSAAGFLASSEFETLWQHPGAQLPHISLSKDATLGCAVKVESIANFLSVRGMARSIEGSPLADYRRCLVWTESDCHTWVVERRASWTLTPSTVSAQETLNALQAKELWLARRREGADDEALMQETLVLAERLVALVGQDMAAWIVMEAERDYWQRRNRAAELQKARQDRLGMGWANHDHHTFRSSRALFGQLIQLMEALGFHCRERFYAGEEAGWGAQVMENPRAQLILFLDVDLEPGELEIDFLSETLPPHQRLGTVGLWCALHGDSILSAGMHHLEGQFDFTKLREDLDAVGIGMMKPFSDFPHLKQAFTHGEQWPVRPGRIEALVKAQKISPSQGQSFLQKGALGSHLENLQRTDGYKGFNQQNVSSIIARTDPRKNIE